MNRLFTNLLSKCLKQRIYYSKYAYSEEFSVNQFCKLHITVPFNIKLRPLDLHTYPNSDKLLIKFQSDIKPKEIDFNFSEDKDSIYITSNYETPSDIKCYIEAPIKADLHITTTNHGSIDVKQFKGDNIILNSQSGDIISENCQNSTVVYTSKHGNIVSNGTLHAANITLETQESGCIIANHLQSIKCVFKTQDGDVRTESCYSDDSYFQTETGKLMLNNIHKNCIVDILDCGILQMTGFDGTLNANIKSGEADIQLTKLHDVSEINIEERSPVLIRIAETVMDNTAIDTHFTTMAIAETIKMLQEKRENVVNFTPIKNKYQSKLIINCPTSHVVIEEASWADMFGLKERNY